MDRKLTKFAVTCLVCQVFGFAAAAPLQDSFFGVPSTFQRPSPITKRQSLFGLGSFGLPFSAPNPVSVAKNTFTGFGNLFSPASSNQQNSEKLIKPKEDHNAIPNTIPSKNKKPLAQDSDNLNKNTNFNPADALQSNTAVNNNRVQESNQNVDNKKDSPNKGSIAVNVNPNNYDKVEEEKIEVDKAIVEALFKEIAENEITSTEYPSDYTTETGEYESTTLDDLAIRIPAAAVASLLG